MGGSFGATKSLYPLFGAEPRARHADLGGGLRRRRRRRRRGGPAAGRRRDVGRLHRARLRPDLQPGRRRCRTCSAARRGCRSRSGSRWARASAPPPSTRGRSTRSTRTCPGSRWSSRRRRTTRRASCSSRSSTTARCIFFEHLKLYVAKGAGAGGAVPDPARRGRGAARRAATSRSSRSRRWSTARSRRRSCSPPSGTSAEVIDPRTLSPLDEETILALGREDRRARRRRREPAALQRRLRDRGGGRREGVRLPQRARCGA